MRPDCTYFLHGKKMTYDEFRDKISNDPELIEKYSIGSSKVPNSPFLKNWEELTLKRVLRMAAEEGYDRVAWINGEQTADRYSLSKQVDAINWIKSGDEIMITAFKDKKRVIEKNDIKASELASVIGKPPAQKILDSKERGGTLDGIDLEIGGEWTTALYDRMIPKFLEKYGKKWGTKVGSIGIATKSNLEMVGEYEGPEHNIQNVEQALEWSTSGQENLGSRLEGQLREIIQKMDGGMSFKDAMSKEGSVALAKHFNGEIKEAGTRKTMQQSIPITPEMRESVLYEGQPMFQKEGQREPTGIRREPTEEVPEARRRNLPPEEAPTSDARTPIMRAFRDFQRAVGTAIGERLPEDGITISDTPQTEAHQVADRLVSEEFGGTPIWFSVSPEARDLGVNFGGAQLTNHPDVVLMNTETKAPVIITAVHETMHRMQQQRPDLYWEVRDAMVEESTPEFEGFRQKMLDKGYSEREVMDEMVAEISGQRFVDQGFLKRLAERSPEAFREFVDTLRRVIEDIRAWIKGANITHAGKYFRDLDRVDTVLADAMVEFRRSEQGRRQPQRMAAQRETKLSREEKEKSPEAMALSSLFQEVRKYDNVELFSKDFRVLYHGGSEKILGNKLVTGGRVVGEVTEENLGKGQDYGGIFFTPERQLAETFRGHSSSGRGRVHSFVVKTKNLFDERNARDRVRLQNFIGKKYNEDGEEVEFTKQMYDFVFPMLYDKKRHMDWATFNPNILEAMGYDGANVIENYGDETEGPLFSTVLFKGGKDSPHWRIPDSWNIEDIFNEVQKGEIPDIRFSRDQTKTEAFRNWFKGSKVVDENGEPLVVYHSTQSDRKVNVFDTSKEGTHFGTREQAENVRGFRKKPEAYFINIKNPLRMSDIGVWNNFNGLHARLANEDIITPKEADDIWAAWQKTDEDGWNKIKKVLNEKGYDGIVYENEVEGEGLSYIAFSPTQIKSATGNRGTFDPENPDIRFSRETKDQIDRKTGIAEPEIMTNEYRATELRQAATKLRRKLGKAPQAVVDSRADLELRIRDMDDLSKETVQAAIISYADFIGLTGEPRNQIVAIVRRSKTPADLRRAVESMDRIMERRQHSALVKRATEAVAETFVAIKRAQGKTRSTVDAEANRQMQEYVKNLMPDTWSVVDENGKTIETFGSLEDAKELVKTSEDYRVVSDNERADKMVSYWLGAGKEVKTDIDRYASDLGKDVLNWIDKGGAIPANAQKIVNTIIKSGIADRSNADLLRIIRDLRSIRKFGRTAYMAQEAQRKTRETAEARQAASEIKLNRPIKSKERQAAEATTPAAKKQRDKEQSKWKKYGYGLLSAETIMEKMSGWKSNPKLKQLLFDPFYRAASSEARQKKAIVDFFKKTYGNDVWKMRIEPMVDLIYEEKFPGEEPRRTTQTLTVEQAMGIYALSKDPGQRRRLAMTIAPENLEFAEAQIDQVSQALPKQYRDMVEKQWDYYYENQYNRINPVYRKEHNIDMPRIRYYMPLGGLNSDPSAHIAEDVMERQSGRASTQKGMTISRTATRMPLANYRYFDMVLGNMQKVEHYIAFNEAVRQANRYMANKDLLEVMDAHSPVAREQIENWINAMARGTSQVKDQDSIDSVINWMRNVYSVFQLGGKLTSMAMQVSALPRGLAFVKPKYAMKALGIIARYPKKTYDMIDDLSPIMEERIRNWDMAVTEFAENEQNRKIFNEKTLGDSWRQIRDFTMYGIGYLDKKVAGAVWLGKYMETLDKEISGGEQQAMEKAVAAADEIVRKTQQGGGLLNSSKLERGSAMSRAITQFMSENRKTLQMAYEYASKFKGMSNKDRASIMALAFIAPSVIVWFIRNGFRPDEPEEILNQSVQNIAAGLPVLGIPVQMAAQKGLDVATEKITGVPKTRAYYETHPNLSAPYMSMFEVTNRAIQGVPEGDWMSGINAGLQFVPAGKQISRAIDAGKIILQEKAAEKEIPGEKASTAAQKAKYFIYAEKAVNRDFYYMRSKFRSKDPREQRKADEMYKKLSKTEKKRFDLFMARLAIEAGKRKEKAGKKLEKITESMKE